MKNIKLFISALETLFYSWGSECGDEVIWGCNGLLDWYEKEYNVTLGIRFERDSNFKDNFEEVFNKLREISSL